jgi:hypothetical protein
VNCFSERSFYFRSQSLHPYPLFVLRCSSMCHTNITNLRCGKSRHETGCNRIARKGGNAKIPGLTYAPSQKLNGLVCGRRKEQMGHIFIGDNKVLADAIDRLRPALSQ